MRQFLDAIFYFIGATSLTDAEFQSINQTGLAVSNYNAETYIQLSNVLVSRDSISETQDRLRFFFMSKGTAVSALTTAKSNILIGGSIW